MRRPEDVQATFCATLVDEWARGGVTDAVVAPGSRSTPLLLALAAEPRIAVHTLIDERSAAFVALGIGRSTGRPALVTTTSGTAAVELHPAVVEAHQATVALIACTADRPPELIDVGAPQAIDQTRLYGTAVRWFHDAGVADEASLPHARALARRTIAEATGAHPGPVQVNLPFREPLVGTAGPLPPAPAHPDPPPLGGPAFGALPDPHRWVGQRGLMVAGDRSGPADDVGALADRLGWPIIASPLAPVFGADARVVTRADALLRVPALAEELRPEVVIRLGGPPASRVVTEWLAASGAEEIVVAGGRWIDPAGTATAVLDADPADAARAWRAALEATSPATGDTAGAGPTADADPTAGTPAPPVEAWRRRWLEVDAAAEEAITAALGSIEGPTEPGIARTTFAAVPAGSPMVVSSSMPVRDLEWYAGPRTGVPVHTNRGANGIDGVISTAAGVAIGAQHPTVALVGDLAFLHDVNGLLVEAAGGTVDLVVVVVDNDGGGIFSFLPQARAVPPEVFERLYGTPHGLDLASVARAHGVDATEVPTEDELAAEIPRRCEAGGAHVLVIRTDRGVNIDVHDRLHAAVAVAVADL